MPSKRKKSKKEHFRDPVDVVIAFLSRRIPFGELCEIVFGSDDDIFDFAIERFPDQYKKYCVPKLLSLG